jgi:hypothetical protein
MSPLHGEGIIFIFFRRFFCCINSTLLRVGRTSWFPFYLFLFVTLIVVFLCSIFYFFGFFVGAPFTGVEDGHTLSGSTTLVEDTGTCPSAPSEANLASKREASGGGFFGSNLVVGSRFNVVDTFSFRLSFGYIAGIVPIEYYALGIIAVRPFYIVKVLTSLFGHSSTLESRRNCLRIETRELPGSMDTPGTPGDVISTMQDVAGIGGQLVLDHPQVGLLWGAGITIGALSYSIFIKFFGLKNPAGNYRGSSKGVVFKNSPYPFLGPRVVPSIGKRGFIPENAPLVLAPSPFSSLGAVLYLTYPSHLILTYPVRLILVVDSSPKRFSDIWLMGHTFIGQLTYCRLIPPYPHGAYVSQQGLLHVNVDLDRDR